MSLLKLYSCALVLAVWATAWWVGVRSDELVGACLALLAVTVVISERERTRRRRSGHG